MYKLMKKIITLISILIIMPLQSFSQDVVITKKEKKRINKKSHNQQSNVVISKAINWLEVMGKPMTNSEVKLITNKLGKPNKLNDDDEFLEGYSKVIVKPWHNEGLRLCFNLDNAQTLKWVYFFPKYYNTCSECKITLPFDFKFTDTPTDLKTKYKNITKKGTDYWIIIDAIKYPNIIFKVNYSRNKITSATLSFKK